MAEIHVEKKRGVGTWLWVLLAIVIVAAIICYLWYTGHLHLSMNTWHNQTLALAGVGGSNGA